MSRVDSPFPTFTGLDNRLLDNGYVWFGEENQDPQTDPVAIFSDPEMTIPVVQPVRTKAGVLSDGDAPINVYTAGPYSIRVRDFAMQQVVYLPSVVDLSSSLGGSGGAASVGFIQEGAGAVPSNLQSKARQVISAADFGVVGDGVANDQAALLNAVAAARTDTPFVGARTNAQTVMLPPGVFRITSLLQLAPANGLAGLHIKGAGSGGTTTILFDGSAASLACQGSRNIVFEDIYFQSAGGVDSDQSAFTIAAGGINPRSWRFVRCIFEAFYKCFSVTGAALDSEFHFYSCQFAQCYYLMDNNNEQAVNWNFVNCDWENNELATVKSFDSGSVLRLQKGTSVVWTGGSFVFHGMLVYCNFTQPGVMQRAAHSIHFNGVRMEMEPNASNSHAPLIDRVSTGYVSGSNAPAITIRDCTILSRGSIPDTVTLARIWNSCAFTFQNIQTEGGKVVGILDSNTASQCADLMLYRARGVSYAEDTTNRVNDHDAHHVTIIPENNSSGSEPTVIVRNCGLSTINSSIDGRMWVSGPTGSLPLGGTTIPLPRLPVHSFVECIFVHGATGLGQNLTVELRDQADSSTYGIVTVNAGSRIGVADIMGEIGFQIPDTPLMLKFTGTPSVTKGRVGIKVY